MHFDTPTFYYSKLLSSNHLPTYNVKQFACNGLLTGFVIHQRQFLKQFVGIVSSNLHGHRAGGMFRRIRIEQHRVELQPQHLGQKHRQQLFARRFKNVVTPFRSTLLCFSKISEKQSKQVRIYSSKYMPSRESCFLRLATPSATTAVTTEVCSMYSGMLLV